MVIRMEGGNKMNTNVYFCREQYEDHYVKPDLMEEGLMEDVLLEGPCIKNRPE